MTRRIQWALGTHSTHWIFIPIASSLWYYSMKVWMVSGWLFLLRKINAEVEIMSMACYPYRRKSSLQLMVMEYEHRSDINRVARQSVLARYLALHLIIYLPLCSVLALIYRVITMAIQCCHHRQRRQDNNIIKYSPFQAHLFKSNEKCLKWRYWLRTEPSIWWRKTRMRKR